MDISSGMWMALVLGGFPFLGLLFVVVEQALVRSSSQNATVTYWRHATTGRHGISFHRYGDGVGMYRTHLFGSPSIITCFPAVNKYVLQSDDIFTSEWPNVDLMGPTSLVSVSGKSHTRVRSYVTNVINRPDALRRIALLVQPRIIAALESWAQKGRIKAFDEANKLSFENIGQLFISMDPGPLLDTIDNLFTGLLKGVRAQPINIPGFVYHHARQCRQTLDAIFRMELEKKNQSEVLTNDLMDGLMQIKDDEGNKLSDQEVIDNIVSLVIAGYASTSLASMWAIYFLAKYPNVLQKLREENMCLSEKKKGDIKSKKKGDLITSDDISKMKYTNKVVDETIRMANLAAFIFRLATKEAEYKGYRIPKGWKVILWIRYIHTNSENFDNPLCFNPDRWGQPAYQVFGGGPRVCAGNMLVRIQLAILLHHLSVGYKWKLLNPDAGMVYLSHPKPIDNVDITISKI